MSKSGVRRAAAANAGIMTLMGELGQTRDLPMSVKTGVASAAGAAFRVLLMPVGASVRLPALPPARHLFYEA